ncbi:MAG: DUF4143 domain-containing protein [Micrococcales bacterium]|nr:DUF4143 domain-containing protein [Micrococcales bacterium]
MRPPGAYTPRLVDGVVAASLRTFGAVLIEGPKWSGKTWTGMTHAQSAVWVADPTGDYLTRRIAKSDPMSLLVGDKPVLIDEWQDAPGLWDAVRLAVDRSPGPGQYLLTGSATPRDGVVSHSGTGRIGRVSMWPMTLFEAGVSGGEVSLASLLDGEVPSAVAGRWNQTTLIATLLRGGWPGSLGKPVEEAAGVCTSYVRSVAFADALVVDGVQRDPSRLVALISSLSRNTATLVANTTLARDMAATGSQGASTKTIAGYLDVLRRLHVLQEIPAWAPALRSPVRLRQSPKRMLCDPSLAAAGMRATQASLQADRKMLGLLFENLCLRDLSVYAQAMSAGVFHYRDESELEVDAIVEMADGRWFAVEAKLSRDQENAAARSLLALAKKMVEGGERPPAALIVLVGLDGFAHRREDGVFVVPIDMLGP